MPIWNWMRWHGFRRKGRLDMQVEDAPFDFVQMREYMVEHDIQARGINDPRVLAAMRSVPREYFVRPVDWDEAYADMPLEIEASQTISQPYVVAFMSQILAVEPGMTILEIGTGSGYQTAILSKLGARVFSMERHEMLSRSAQEALKRVGLGNGVSIKVGDGSSGWKEKAPFDRIILTCCAPEISQVLLAQLSADSGILLAPVETARGQFLRKIVKHGNEFEEHDELPVRFVPLIGEFGFED